MENYLPITALVFDILQKFDYTELDDIFCENKTLDDKAFKKYLKYNLITDKGEVTQLFLLVFKIIRDIKYRIEYEP